MAIKDYSTEPDMNTTISGINIAEGCAPSGINNAIRQLMADVKAGNADLDTALRALIAEEVAKCLKTTGGTMTGNVRFSQDDDTILYRDGTNGRFIFRGGASGFTDGASIYLHGKDHPDKPGQFVVYAHDGTKRNILELKPDGTCLLANSQVLTAADGGVNPPGTVIAFAANKEPSGYLLCNGAAVSRTTYAALFAAIGTAHGSGDGSTTFNLPNLTDKFIQGSGTAGTTKSAGLPNLSGQVTGIYGNKSGSTTGVFRFSPGADQTNGDYTSSWRYSTIQFFASDNNSIYGNSSTVQPPAVTMRYYIKY